MSRRLYYTDAYTTTFEAVITERLAVDGAPAVILAATYFYPTSGGQPYDTGHLGERQVVNVMVREADNVIVHVLDGDLPQAQVAAQVDWARRFDHMQQHTGQHILSQALIQTADASTIGFHLGEESCTIDLDVTELTAAQRRHAEQLANAVVWENRPLHVQLLTHAQAAQLPLRKTPEVTGDYVRVVEIEGFDLTACGGTHVAQTGEVGLIKITHLERMRGGVRVVFCCGRRALADYGVKNEVARSLMLTLTCGLEETPAAVQRLQAEVKSTRQALKKAQAAQRAWEATALVAGAEKWAGQHLIVHSRPTGDLAETRQLAQQLLQQPGVIALLGVAGETAHLLFARTPDAAGAMDDLLATALPHLGEARGGGRAAWAQGGGVTASLPQIQAALAAARQQLQASMATTTTS